MIASTRKAPYAATGPSSDELMDGQARVETEYLFLSHTLAVGGIETLLTRMANALAREGFPVTVLAPRGPIGKYLDPTIRVIEWQGDQHTLENYKPQSLAAHVNIWCSLPALMIDAWPLQKRLWQSRQVRSSCIAGIFHPEQWYHQGPRSAAYLNGRLIQALAEPGSIYFMNDASLAAHVARWGDHLERCPVFRLHLDDETGIRWRPTGLDRLKIVSVGRIVPFKNYNYDACALLAELAGRGIDASWDIFGDGPDRERLVAKAAAAGFADRLRFRGEVAYDRLRETLLFYDLFVGMGTAALEAASIAMPTLLALSDKARGSYGFLDEAPSDSVAEVIEGVPPVDLGKRIGMFAAAGDEERIQIGERCRASATERGGAERAPFDNMFVAGRQYPTSMSRSVRAELLFAARRVKQRLERTAVA